MAKFLLLMVITISITLLPASAVVKGGVDYAIPLDYKNFNQKELSLKAESYYNKALQQASLTEDMTAALNLYNILCSAYPDNIVYALKLGKLYDVLGENRMAKAQYYRAIGINKSYPDSYFYLGDYFYNREQYRKALKFYKKALEKGYSDKAAVKAKINIIHKKLGIKN